MHLPVLEASDLRLHPAFVRPGAAPFRGALALSIPGGRPDPHDDNGSATRPATRFGRCSREALKVPRREAIRADARFE